MAVKVRFTGEASGFEAMALPGRSPVKVGDVVSLPDAELADRWVANGNFEHVGKKATSEPAAPAVQPEPAVPAHDGGPATEAGQKKKGDS